MVRTGARANALQALLVQAGYRPTERHVSSPRIDGLSSEVRVRVMNLYRALGGTGVSVQLRPGAWDLLFEGGLIVELDEELHFNRYRATTLEPAWAARLPWRDDYLKFSTEHEAACLAAAQWGKRWTSPSCERLFGPADPPGTFGAGGAPRWKQRALYDAMKDAAALDFPQTRLARLATLDAADGVQLGTALEGRARLDPHAFHELLMKRTLQVAA